MLKNLFTKGLKREIALILIIKVILITLIWVFFVKEHSVKFNDQEVANHLIEKPTNLPPLQQNMESSHDF